MENDALEKALANPAEVMELNLRYNELTSLPSEIWQMTNLERLNLGYNELTSLPSEIGQLANLKRLNLGYNKLTSWPAEIGQLTNLERIYLGDKRLIEIARALVVSGCKISYYGLGQ